MGVAVVVVVVVVVVAVVSLTEYRALGWRKEKVESAPPYSDYNKFYTYTSDLTSETLHKLFIISVEDILNIWIFSSFYFYVLLFHSKLNFQSMNWMGEIGLNAQAGCFLGGLVW